MPTKEENILSATIMTQDYIKNLIYIVRGQQVMLDSDLAVLYHADTKVFNQAVKRNIARFPDSFRFQLTKEEYDHLRSQIVTSNKRGGRRYLPYVFTEQGIAMLSAILHSDVAIQISVDIMTAFVEMRKFLANNSLLFEKISEINWRQIAYEKETEQRFEQVFDYLSEQRKSKQNIFFDGQIFDAFSLLINLINQADTAITLIDNYVDVNTLNILAKKKEHVDVCIYTMRKTRLTDTDIETFNKQYPELTVKYTGTFHDRFLIIDENTAYHIGASLKDAGKKCFAISLLEDSTIISSILQNLESGSAE